MGTNTPYMREWRAKKLKEDPDYFKKRYNPEYWKNHHLKKKYGITGEQWQEMYDKQDGLCAICKENEATCVDHCHDTGEIRGLLCRTCNTGIGHLNDDPALLKAAIHYLTFN
jgi:hypothetical protein